MKWIKWMSCISIIENWWMFVRISLSLFWVSNGRLMRMTGRGCRYPAMSHSLSFLTPFYRSMMRAPNLKSSSLRNHHSMGKRKESERPRCALYSNLDLTDISEKTFPLFSPSNTYVSRCSPLKNIKNHRQDIKNCSKYKCFSLSLPLPLPLPLSIPLMGSFIHENKVRRRLLTHKAINVLMFKVRFLSYYPSQPVSCVNRVQFFISGWWSSQLGPLISFEWVQNFFLPSLFK